VRVMRVTARPILPLSATRPHRHARRGVLNSSPAPPPDGCAGLLVSEVVDNPERIAARPFFAIGSLRRDVANRP
jgi:hypothetical protein